MLLKLLASSPISSSDEISSLSSNFPLAIFFAALLIFSKALKA